MNDDTFVPEKPVWIEKVGGTVYDLAPDGKRVVVLTPDSPKADHEVCCCSTYSMNCAARAGGKMIGRRTLE